MKIRVRVMFLIIIMQRNINNTIQKDYKKILQKKIRVRVRVRVSPLFSASRSIRPFLGKTNSDAK
jgi:hypothetical protein